MADERERQRNAHRDGGGSAREAIRAAKEVLRDIVGRDAEAVSRVQREDRGWVVSLEVVELRRIPDSVDLLASFDVHLDEDGELVGCQRVRRYTRGETSDWG